MVIPVVRYNVAAMLQEDVEQAEELGNVGENERAGMETERQEDDVESQAELIQESVYN